MNWTDFAQAALDGVLFGSTYSLIGVGFTLIFGVLHKINLAYAASSIAGAYCSLLLLSLGPLPAPLVFVGATLAAGGIGWVVYVCCFRYIPRDASLASLMATVGMLLLIDEIIVHLTDGAPRSYPALFDSVGIDFGGMNLRGDLLFVFGTSVLAMALLMWLIHGTRLGLATRALAQQPTAAQLCGVRVDRVNGATFVLTGMLGGVAGAMLGASVGMLSPLLTMPLTVKGLIVTVIGGLGSIPGAVLAGLLVGGVESMVQVVRGVTERDMYVMLLLFVFLAFRPRGFLGRAAVRD